MRDVDPSCCKPITVKENTIVMPMHMPIDRNTLWLSRRTTKGKPRNKQRDIQQRLNYPRMDCNADFGVVTHAAIVQPGDQLRGRGKLSFRW